MQNNRLKTLLVLLLATSLLLAAAPAMAHKVNIFAYVEGETVYTESYFPDGQPVLGGVIEVYNETGKKILQGKTDDDGLFSFSLSKREDLKIVIVASMGHKNSYTLKKSEM